MCQCQSQQQGAMQHGYMVSQGSSRQQWRVRLPIQMTSCAGYVPFWALVQLMLSLQKKPVMWEWLGFTNSSSLNKDLSSKPVFWLLKWLVLDRTICQVLSILASIIPVWRAETIKGWNGRSNVDAAISSPGFSFLTALDKHCTENMYVCLPWAASSDDLTTAQWEYDLPM